jgi:hypothetical protein
MLPVEQVFLQVRLHSGNWSADVTAATKSVQRADLSEMTDWFSTSEKELTLRCDPFNLFFHPLPSGHYALGVIYPAQRSFFAFFQQPQTLNIRILVLTSESLLEQGNHPIALFDMFRRRHQVPFVSQPPKHLSPLIPVAPPSLLDRALLELLVERPGAMALAQLTQSLFNAEYTLFTSKSVTSFSVLSVLLDILPIHYRPELTFSTDFFFSSKNSFRLSGFSGVRQRAVRFLKQWGIPVIALEKGNKGSIETLDPWSRFVYQLLQTRNFDFLERYRNMEHRLATFLPVESQPIIWETLHESGVSMSKAMASGTLPDTHVMATDIPTHSLEELRCVAAVDQMIPMLTVPKANSARPVSNQRLAERFPQFRSELTELETNLVRGIFGDELILPKVKQLWSLLLTRLDNETQEIIREEIIATIHAVLQSLEGTSGQRLLRSSQLLELMVFFLQRDISSAEQSRTL